MIFLVFGRKIWKHVHEMIKKRSLLLFLAHTFNKTETWDSCILLLLSSSADDDKNSCCGSLLHHIYGSVVQQVQSSPFQEVLQSAICNLFYSETFLTNVLRIILTASLSIIKIVQTWSKPYRVSIIVMWALMRWVPLLLYHSNIMILS